MEMRLLCAAMVLLGVMAASASAGEKSDKPVSPSTLQAMGLGQMQPLAESEGSQVRGKFTFARVRGFSQVGGNIQPYFDMGTNFASGFEFVFSGGGFAGGGAFGFAN